MIPDQTHAGSPPAGPSSPRIYSPCEHCGAPLDEPQRYCLNCGSRRKHGYDPAARVLAAASRRQKPAPAADGPAREGSISALTLGAILLIPLALGIGVLVGRSSSNPDAKLLSALRAPTTAAGSPAGGGATGAASLTAAGSAGSSSPRLVVGSWTRTDGYTIELSSLPKGTSPAAAARIEQSDRRKGAASVGILATAAYRITPSPGGAYVIYSGSYGTLAAAHRALTRLRKRFPSAHVLHVASPSATANTPVVTHTQYGSAHQVVGYKPSKAALNQGAQVATQDAHSTGKRASGAGLPDVVSVP